MEQTGDSEKVIKGLEEPKPLEALGSWKIVWHRRSSLGEYQPQSGTEHCRRAVQIRVFTCIQVSQRVHEELNILYSTLYCVV